MSVLCPVFLDDTHQVYIYKHKGIDYIAHLDIQRIICHQTIGTFLDTKHLQVKKKHVFSLMRNYIKKEGKSIKLDQYRNIDVLRAFKEKDSTDTTFRQYVFNWAIIDFEHLASYLRPYYIEIFTTDTIPKVIMVAKPKAKRVSKSRIIEDTFLYHGLFIMPDHYYEARQARQAR